MTRSSLVHLDGAHAEGGGALFRTALTMSVVTQQSCSISNIRGGTKYPGIDAEDATLIRALGQSCAAQTSDLELGLNSFEFHPTRRAHGFNTQVQSVRGDSGRGANSLVLLSSFLPVAVQSGRYSSFSIEGETYGTNALGFDAFAGVTVPTLAQMGIHCDPSMEFAGFGRDSRGMIDVAIEPSLVHGLNWTDRGRMIECRAVVVTSELPAQVGQRASGHLAKLAQTANLPIEVDNMQVDGRGPGVFCTVWARYERAAGSGSAMGTRGLRAELMAQQAFEGMFDWIRSDSNLDPYLADQIIVPLCMADSSSSFKVQRLTSRLLTQIWVIKQFAPIRVTVRGVENGPGLITIER